jgi:hypothetical protein
MGHAGTGVLVTIRWSFTARGSKLRRSHVIIEYSHAILFSKELVQEFPEFMIDLRSDTVTRPTPAMRRAMFEAEVGDDVYREDPTVNRLEERAAEIAGKPAALFVPTGTMGNTIAIKLLTEHGQEVICDSRAHLLDYELSMMAWFSGCLIRAVPRNADCFPPRRSAGTSAPSARTARLPER